MQVSEGVPAGTLSYCTQIVVRLGSAGVLVSCGREVVKVRRTGLGQRRLKLQLRSVGTQADCADGLGCRQV